MIKTIQEIEDILKEKFCGKYCKLKGIDQMHRFHFTFEKDESLIEDADIINQGE